MIYPALGLGWMHDILFLQNKSKTPPSFDEALTDFQGEQRLMADNFSLNLSFFYTWAIDKEKDFLINVHAGYRLGLNHARWKLESGEGLTESPKTSASGFFAGIGFSL